MIAIELNMLTVSLISCFAEDCIYSETVTEGGSSDSKSKIVLSFATSLAFGALSL